MNEGFAKTITGMTIEEFRKYDYVVKGTEFGELKQSPKATDEEVEKVISENPIYSEVMKHFKSQVAYGIDKYPEPLNIDTWTMVESLNHKIGEMVDELNYTVMLKQQLERLNKDLTNLFGIKREDLR